MISGCGFGSNPTSTESTLFDGSVVTHASSTTPAILVSEIDRAWGAGFGGDEIGLFIGSWSDSQIVINGFGGSTTGDSSGQPLVGPDPNSYKFPILSGNQIYLDIVGPGCTSTDGGWPQKGTTPNPPRRSFRLAVELLRPIWTNTR